MKLLTLIILCAGLSVFAGNLKAQVKPSNSSSVDKEFTLSNIRSSSELNLVLNNYLKEIEDIIVSPNTPKYDKSLFRSFALLINDVKGSASVEGINVINVSFEKIKNQIELDNELKEVSVDHLKSLLIGLVEVMQVVPQVNNATIE